jgi:hypothetical protein
MQGKRKAARHVANVLSSVVRDRFRNRGFSDRTIEAMVACGMDAPERLLFMNEDEFRHIPEIGKPALAQITRYRETFLPPAQTENVERV